MDINVHNITSNQFTKYSDNSVSIGEDLYSTNIIVTNDNIYDFNKSKVEDVRAEDILSVLSSSPDLILFGTGNKIIYPNALLLQQLQAKNIGIEVMSIKALCRTYNFLVSEDRQIACVLMFENN